MGGEDHSSRRTCSAVPHTHVEEIMTIFKKAGDNDTPDTVSATKIEPTRQVRTKNVSVIGPTLVFKGEFSADEDLIIEGQIEGTITHHKKHLTVGQQGRIKADIHASSVIVLGKVTGDIHSEGMVTLSKGANVNGDIFCGRIVMEDGARFKGKVDMGDAPKVAAVPKAPEKTESTGKEKPRIVAGQSAKASVY